MRGTGDQGKDHLHGEDDGRDDVGVPVFSFAGDDMQVFVHGILQAVQEFSGSGPARELK
jgi:hypothetical protein